MVFPVLKICTEYNVGQMPGRGDKEKARWPVIRSAAEGGVRERDRQVFFNFSKIKKEIFSCPKAETVCHPFLAL